MEVAVVGEYSIHDRCFILQCEDKCVIRRFTLDDAPAVVDIVNHADVVRFMSERWALPFTLQQAQAFIRDSNAPLPQTGAGGVSDGGAHSSSSGNEGSGGLPPLSPPLTASFAVEAGGAVVGSIGLRTPCSPLADDEAAAHDKAPWLAQLASCSLSCHAGQATSMACECTPGMGVEGGQQADAADSGGGLLDCSSSATTTSTTTTTTTTATSDGCYELGFFVGRTWWGRGFASAAARALVAHVMNHEPERVQRLVALVVPCNTASVRVLGQCGLELQRTLPGAGGKGGEVHDLLVYGIAHTARDGGAASDGS